MMELGAEFGRCAHGALVRLNMALQNSKGGAGRNLSTLEMTVQDSQAEMLKVCLRCVGVGVRARTGGGD